MNRDICPGCGQEHQDGELESVSHTDDCPWYEAFQTYWVKYADGAAAIVHADKTWQDSTCIHDIAGQRKK